MNTSLKDLEKIINSGLTTSIKKSEIKFNQLFVDVKVTRITVYDGGRTVENHQSFDGTLIGEIPIMLRCCCCHLSGLGNLEAARQNECIYDEGGYFIVKGNEKVLTAQERQRNNCVFVFKKDVQNVDFQAEIR